MATSVVPGFSIKTVIMGPWYAITGFTEELLHAMKIGLSEH